MNWKTKKRTTFTMNYLFVCAIILGFKFCGFAQNQFNYDTIYYHNGNYDVVNIVRNSSDVVECLFPNEEMITSISKEKIHKIIFKSGRIENIITQNDTILLINGSSIVGHIIKISDSDVEYRVGNDNVTHVTVKHLIKEIHYADGSIDDYTNIFKIKVIDSQDQWEDVVVTYNENDVKGLELVKEISKASGWGGMLATGAGYNDAIKKLKKEAAKLKCSIILIHGSPNQHTTMFGAGTRVNAAAYRIPNAD
jgi:hypothetical protein